MTAAIFAWDVEQSQRVNVVIGICHRELTTTEWCVHWKDLQIPGNYRVGLSSHQPIDLARNALAELAFQHNAEWLFYLDSDVLPPSDALTRLISHNLPVVSGLYYMRTPPHEPLALRDMPGVGLTPVASWRPGELIDVDAIGMGSCLIHRRVLERIPRPWFEWSYGEKRELYVKVKEDEEETHKKIELHGVSEDYEFCYKLKKHGFKIYVDTGVVCPHQTIANIVGRNRLEASKIP